MKYISQIIIVTIMLFPSLSRAQQIQITEQMRNEIERQGEALSERVNLDDGLDEREIADIQNTTLNIFRMIYGNRPDLWSEISARLDSILNTFKVKKDNVINKVKDILPSSEDDEENPFEETGLDAVKPGSYDFEKWPDGNGIKIAKIVDVYGVERYTSDGKHFYDNPYSAANSQSGLRGAWNGMKDTLSNVGDWFWGGKSKDPEENLQRNIASEVLKDTKSLREKDIEKAYKKYADKANKISKFASVPANAVIETMKAVSKRDFESAAVAYIKERESGKSQKYIRENFDEIFTEGYGTFGNQGAISLSTSNKYAKAVLYARFEEVYQRYKIAKEFGRED